MNKRKIERQKQNSKKRKVMKFINEVNKIGFKNCNRAECRSNYERLYDLSYKIVSHCDLSDLIFDAESHKDDALEFFAVQTARCLIHPPYLYEFWGNWNPENGELLSGTRTDIMFFIKDIISDYSKLLTPLEKIKFGEAVLFIENLFLCPDCGLEPDIIQREFIEPITLNEKIEKQIWRNTEVSL